MGDRRGDRHFGDRESGGRKRHKSGPHDDDWEHRRRDRSDRDRGGSHHGGWRRDGAGAGGGGGGRDRDDSAAPTHVVVLRNLHPDTSQEKILYTLKAYGPVNDVRLIRDKATGESRGFAFVEFPSLEDAQQFLEYHNMRLDLDGRIVYMDYSRQKDPHSNEYRDWICPQCSTTNFSRRSACYTCQAPKPANPVLVAQGQEEATDPGPVLAVRGLDMSTMEASVYTTFSAFAAVKEVRLVRDKGTNISRGFCFVEFHSVEDATYVLQNCSQLQIDGHTVRLSYARKGQSDRHHHHQRQPYNVANAALEQAQWASQNQATAGFPSETTGQVQSGDAAAAAAAAAAWNGLGFCYDAQSGYYYNAATGYCYHPVTQGYYYFDPTTQTPVSVSAEVALAAPPLPAGVAMTTAAASSTAAESTDTAAAATKEAESKSSKKEKKKKAKTLRDKKMSQELDRWMKMTQELKQEDAKDASAAEVPKQKITISFGTTNKLLGSGGAHSQGAGPEEETTTDTLPPEQIPASLPAQPAQFLPINESADGAVVQQEVSVEPQQQHAIDNKAPVAQASLFPQESARPDVGLEFACLLCKRKFVKARTLALHLERSSLHKTNQEMAHELEVEQIRELTRMQQKEKGETLRETRSIPETKKKRGIDLAIGGGEAAAGSGSAAAAKAALGEGIGGQMLKKMGWKQGTGLGKEATGIVNPIEVSRRAERAGLGAVEEDVEVELDPNDTYQDVAKKKARARLSHILREPTKQV